jgi:hypothetical protein
MKKKAREGNKSSLITSGRELFGVDDLGGELETSRFLNTSPHNGKGSPRIIIKREKTIV